MQTNGTGEGHQHEASEKRLAPDGREALQCVMNKLGGPEGVEASLESKEGEQPTASFNAATECGLTMANDDRRTFGLEPPGMRRSSTL